MGKVRRRVLRREKEGNYAALVEYSTKLWRAMGAPRSVLGVMYGSGINERAKRLCAINPGVLPAFLFDEVLAACSYDKNNPEHVLTCAVSLADYREFLD